MTALYAQHGSKHVVWNTGEVLTCYTIEELRHIANMTIELEKTIKLYNISKQQLNLKDSIIHAKEQAILSKDSVIVSKESVISLKEEIITGKDYEIADLRSELQSSYIQIKWLKFEYGGTTLILSGLLIYAVFK